MRSESTNEGLCLGLKGLSATWRGWQIDRTLAGICVALIIARHRGLMSCSIRDLAELLGDIWTPETIYERLWRLSTLESDRHLPIHRLSAGRSGRVSWEGEAPPLDEAVRWRNGLVDDARAAGRLEGQRRGHLADEVDRFESLIQLGRLSDAHRYLRDAGLRRRIGRGASGQSRAALTVRVHRLLGSLLMQQGHDAAACEPLSRAAEAASAAGLWLDRWHALGNLTAALRMAGPSRLMEAQGIYGILLNELSHHGGGLDPPDRAEVERWVWASFASPLLIQGSYLQASEATERALDALGGVDDHRLPYAQAEVRLRRVRQNLGMARVSAAWDEFERAWVEYRRAPALQWLEGWFPRYRADLLVMSGQPAAALASLLEAWAGCDGFGFQRAHLAARFVELAPQVDAAPLEQRAFRREVATLHLQFVGIWPGRCHRCRGGRTIEVMQCLLGARWPDAPPSFFH